MASARTGAALEIRKVRKKLRQIENLERQDRDLTDEELNKILKKSSLRENLLQLLTKHGEEESFTSSRGSEDIFTEPQSSFPCDDYDGGYNNSNVGGEITFMEPEDETNTEMIDVDILDDVEDEDIAAETTNATEQIVQQPNIGKENPVVPIATTTQPSQKSNPSPSKKSKKSVTTDTKTSEKPEKSSKLKTTLHNWRFGRFRVTELEGHNDLITDTDTDGLLLVTSSRDTTVKLWSIDTMEELRNYGGHSSTVTCVHLLSQEDSSHVCKCLELEEVHKIFISGSYDCSFKIWTTGASGEVVRSVYTFNPVTKVIYHPVAKVIITGSDGGKLEVWDISTGENLQSIHPYEEAVTGLKVIDGAIYSSSADGFISVHTLQDKNFNCLFVSENIRCENNGHLTQRHIRGFDVKNSMIYYGDDGTNIKVLDWKKGMVHKLVNHCEEFGVTDSICCRGDILVSSAYSIDNGTGYVNVRYVPEQTYITTLNDEDSGRIVALSYVKSGNSNVIVMAGMQLKVWIMSAERSVNEEDEELISTRYLPKLAHKHCQDSDVESEVETSDFEDDDDGVAGQRRHSRDSTQGKGWLSWCNVI